MIKNIKILKTDCLPTPWWKEVEYLKNIKELEFIDGINILFGPNGCGKSTIIKLLNRIFCCSYGYPIINEGTIKLFYEGQGVFESEKLSIKIKHDGQPVHFYESSMCIGRDEYGHYDWSVGAAEIVQSKFTDSLSSGQYSGSTLNRILVSALNIDKPDCNMDGNVNSFWQKRINIIKEILKPNIPLGKRTLLLDEPDRTFDIPSQVRFWNIIEEWSKTFQIIIASHNVLAFNKIKKLNANLIELQKGYYNRCKEALQI